MKHRPLKQLCGLIATAAVALVLIGCNGKAGQNGLNGTNGTNGTNGQDGQNGQNATLVVDAGLLTSDQWAALKPTGTVTGVTIPATGARNPVVTFKLTDPAGNGIKGLGNFSTLSIVADRNGNFATVANYPNLAFALAKLVPEDATTHAPSKWVSYIVSTVPTKNAAGAAVAATASSPTTDANGTLVDNGDGTYKYTFYRDVTTMQAFLDGLTLASPKNKADLGDVTYAPTLVHRLTVQVSGAARGTGSNTPNGVTTTASVNMTNPINIVYDFVPGTTGVGTPVAAGTDIRDVVSINNCNECHDKLAFHGGGRVEVRYCVVCHTDQRKFGSLEATLTGTVYSGSTNKINGGAAGDMTALAHRIHRGGNLSKTGYNYANVLFDKLGYSMLDGGERMCIKCHANVPQADNWKNKPTRLACGTCHDNVDFATGLNHGTVANGGPQADDKNCAGCHTPVSLPINHQTQNVTPHNPTVAAGLVNFTYEIKSAAVSGTTATVVFRIKADGTPVTYLAPAAGMANPLTGFTGAPSFLMAYAQDQDGIVAPADYNNFGRANGQPQTVSIAALLDPNKTNGTLSATADASGYYTATILNAFPATAKLRSVSLQGYFTQVSPAAARHTISVVKAVTGDTARRTAIDSAKCANCHEWFEGHGGNRVYEVQVCVTCHVPGLVTSGRGTADDRLEAYRAAGMFTAKDIASLSAWGITIPNPVVVGSNFALNFPQTTNNFKDMIHGIHAGKDRTTPIRIVRDRTNATTANGQIAIIDGANIGFPGILSNCKSCHTYNGYNVPTSGKLLASRELADNGALVDITSSKASIATVSATDKMISPFTAACVTCHDSTAAQAHMNLNGGQIKVNRSALNPALESCAVCHGAGSEFDPVKVHQ